MKRGFMKKNLMCKKGFTLIELMVTLVILGILVATGVPGMQTLLGNMSVNSSANRLLNTMAFARGEALSRSTVVMVCRSSDSATCSGTWNDGWIVIDTLANTVLRVEDNSGSNTTVTGAPANISFNSRGENTGNAASFTVGSTRPGISTKQINVSNVGYASI